MRAVPGHPYTAVCTQHHAITSSALLSEAASGGMPHTTVHSSHQGPGSVHLSLPDSKEIAQRVL